MRALAYLKKTFLENLRGWKVVVLVLVFGPAFVDMMSGAFRAAAPAYSLLVANHDVEGTSTRAARVTLSGARVSIALGPVNRGPPGSATSPERD